MQETWVQSLGQEDPLEEGMATHSSVHTWRIPWTEQRGGLQSTGSERTGHDSNDLAHATAFVSTESLLSDFQAPRGTLRQKSKEMSYLRRDTGNMHEVYLSCNEIR